MVSVEDDDLAGLEDVSTDGEDDNYEAEADSSDGETASLEAPVVRKAHRKKARGGIWVLNLIFEFQLRLIYYDVLVKNIFSFDSGFC